MCITSGAVSPASSFWRLPRVPELVERLVRPILHINDVVLALFEMWQTLSAPTSCEEISDFTNPVLPGL